jgi:Domain of unknown function (DUF4062)
MPLASRELTIFLSSTVEDLRPVRNEIAATLAQRGIKVRKSDDADFPILHGVTSHVACLQAVKNAHILITLVGYRFGGEFEAGKSITWREWETARENGVIPIVLVHKGMNDLSIKIGEKRRDLVAQFPNETASEIDKRLRAMPGFGDWKPLIDDVPAQQRFIDALRKGHVDNWVHQEWTGTAADALRYIDPRLSTLLALSRDTEARAQATAKALRRLARWAAVLSTQIHQGKRDADTATQRLLQFVEQLREELLDFSAGDRYNFMLFRAEGDSLVPGPRVAHAEIVQRNRTWKIGEGHAGLAAVENRILVAPDLRETKAWDVLKNADKAVKEEDAKNYVSAVSIPLSVDKGKPSAVFIVTSSRKDHFTSPEQAEVLTCDTIGRILSLIWMGGDGDVDGI